MDSGLQISMQSSPRHEAVANRTHTVSRGELARPARDLAHRPVVGVFGERQPCATGCSPIWSASTNRCGTRRLFALIGVVRAEQADYPELVAWAHGTQALIAEWTGRHDTAIQHLRVARGCVEHARAGSSRRRVSVDPGRERPERGARVGVHHHRDGRTGQGRTGSARTVGEHRRGERLRGEIRPVWAADRRRRVDRSGSRLGVLAHGSSNSSASTYSQRPWRRYTARDSEGSSAGRINRSSFVRCRIARV